MKFRLIHPVLLATAAVALTSCTDDSDSAPQKPAEQPDATQPAQQEQTAEPAQAEQTEQTGTEGQPDQTEQPGVEGQPDQTEQPGVEEPTPANPGQTEPAAVQPDEPSVEQVSAAIAPLLADFPQLEAGETTITTEAQEDGTLRITATTKILAKEDLARLAQLSDVMDEVRKGINEMANKAMQPDSLYLLQIGAPASDISDTQRAAKPLPEDLQTKADELKDISDVQVGVIVIPGGAEAAVVTTTMTATKSEDGWQLSDVQMDRTPLDSISTPTPVSELPEGTKTLSADFLPNLEAKVAEFNEAAKAYILTREEAARATYTEKQALVEETLKKAEATAAAKAENAETCAGLIMQGKTFSGEWKRGSRFGTAAIFIRKAARYEDSIQFVGFLYDPKLPAASMDISGRCEFTPNEDGEIIIDIEIFDGKYDPNKATAEVFDAGDSIMRLSLSKDGKMKGVMTCRSWGYKSEKAFNVSFAPDDSAEKPE